MIYLQTQTILVTINQFKTPTNKVNYLVGDFVYETLPSSIVNNAFISANWNRALKYGQNFYQTLSFDQDNELLKTGYYKMSFDLYYDEVNQKLVCLTKNSFDQQIVQQKSFSDFLNKIIQQLNKYKDDFNLIINPTLWSTELINLYLKHGIEVNNLSHFIVNEAFDQNQTKARFKYLVKASNEVKIAITNQNQVIYYYNQAELFQDFTYLNLESNVIYLHGVLKTTNQNDLKLAINYEDQLTVAQLKDAILTQFQTYLNDPDLKDIHLFNITGDLKYLITELNSYRDQSYFNVIQELNHKFDLTKSNHFPLIYQTEQLRQILFNFVSSVEELTDFQHQVSRFGVFQKNEVMAVEQKYLELR